MSGESECIMRIQAPTQLSAEFERSLLKELRNIVTDYKSANSTQFLASIFILSIYKFHYVKSNFHEGFNQFIN